MAPQVGLEPTTLRLTAGCSAIELLRSVVMPGGICQVFWPGTEWLRLLKVINYSAHIVKASSILACRLRFPAAPRHDSSVRAPAEVAEVADLTDRHSN